ncbi:hypothetical protein BKX95_09980 [Streptococcus iniae]|nr:hypothetical protein BKX95_09980 [Streptococcus iniae]
MKLNKFFLALGISIVTILSLSACGQSMEKNLQKNTWTISKANNESFDNVKFNENGKFNIKVLGTTQEYNYQVSKGDKEFKLSRNGYYVKFKVESASSKEYKLKYSSAKITDPSATSVRLPDLKRDYKVMNIYR